MEDKAFKEAPRSRTVFGMNLEPGIHKRSDQPSPDGPLMIGRVPGAQVAIVLRLEIGMIGRKRTQAYGGQQLLFDGIENSRPARLVKDGIVHGNGEKLIGPASRIVPF